MNDSDSFFGGARTPEDDASRPRAVNPRTGQVQDWQRASNYASPLDNPHGLIKWKMRELIKGLSLRPDLARMLLTGAVIDDNSKADQIIEQAHSAVAIDAKANEGTAVHAALSRSYLGHEIPAEYVPHVTAFAAELKRNGLTPVATEVRLLCVLLGVLGHTDWIVQTADGRFLILDVKTGKLGDAKRKFAVQCKAYGAAEYLDDGNGGWVPIPFEIDQTEAVLAHVDPQTGATSLYRVDLMLGFYGATLAEKVRNWHKIEVLSPYVPSLTQTGTPVIFGQRVADNAPLALGAPAASAPVAPAPPVTAPTGPAIPAEQGRDAFNHLGSDVVNDVRLQTLAADARTPWEVQKVQEEIQLRAIETRQSSPIVPAVPDDAPPLAGTGHTFEELMQARNDKSTLQQIASKLGCKDLAHNRKWLARWIIATQQGADPVSAAKYAAAKDDAPIAPIGERPSTEPERQAGDLSFIFKSIEGAKSVGAIEALRSNVVERRGDQAWTDEMTEAARTRVAELDAQSGMGLSEAQKAMNTIKAAVEQQEIAAAWTEVTLGGTALDRWTDELNSAAQEQMKKIQESQPPPPANPFGA